MLGHIRYAFLRLGVVRSCPHVDPMFLVSEYAGNIQQAEVLDHKKCNQAHLSFLKMVEPRDHNNQQIFVKEKSVEKK